MSVHMSVRTFATRGASFNTRIFSRHSYGARPRKVADQHRETVVEQLMKIQQLQLQLAVSRSTAYRFIRHHQIPVVYVLGAPRIRAVDVQRALANSGGVK